MRTRSWLSIAVLVLGAGGSAAAWQQRVDVSDSSQRRAVRTENQSAQALRQLKYQEALDAANQGLAEKPKDAFLLYDKAEALRGLNRTDQAVAAARQAESAFGADRHGRSLAIWSQALTLQQAGRCFEAHDQFQRYAAMVQSTDSSSAKMAMRYAQRCPTPATRVVAAGRFRWF